MAMKASPHAHPMYPPRCSDPPRHTLLPCHESVSLSCSERPGPEDWQGPEDSVLFVLSPQTHISLVLFFGLQAPELVSFFFFPLLFFALPPCIQSKALWKRTDHCWLLQAKPRRLISADQVFWSTLEIWQQESSWGLLLDGDFQSSLWAAGTHI